MILRQTLIATLLVCSCGLYAADDDETRFKAKPYTSRNSQSDSKAYRASAYTPSRSSNVSATAFQPAPTQSRWSLFKRKPAGEAKQASAEKLPEAIAYRQQKHTSVPTIKADPGAIQEKKPYIKRDSDPFEAFTPAEKSGWKNPLLKPRQGIKESVE